MAVNAVCFVFGSVVLLTLSDLPPWWLCTAATVCCVLAIRRFPPLCWFLVGQLWAAWHAADVLNARLDSEWLHHEVVVTGVITGLPVQDSIKSRFLFSLEKICHLQSDDCERISGVLTRLSWYQDYPLLAAGQRWRFTVKLREPHGFMNPGGFDYEKWMFQQRVVTTGYVRDSDNASMLNIAHSPAHVFQRVRVWLKRKLEGATVNLKNRGLILAIAIGDRSDINHDQWQQFITTGTNHLLAISGLHISLVAAFAAMIAATVWKRLSVCQRVSRQSCSLIAGFLAAFLYAGLAGFSVPTQRALLMFGVVVLLSILARHQSRQRSLILALALVCAVDPLVVLSAGFWMSFAAVAILLVVYSFVQQSGRQQRVVSVIRGHLLITIGLYPVGILFFGYMSLVSPIANFVAVPVVGMLVTPMVFCSSLLAMISESMARYLLTPVDWLMNWLCVFLSWVSTWDYALRFVGTGDGSILLYSAAVASLCLLPVQWRFRWLVVVLALPLFFTGTDHPDRGEYRVTFLDVGQGTSVVVQTHSHVLVYDTGAKFSDSFNAADAVILPFLRNRGIGSVDTLVVSHADGDHSGGARALLEGIEVAEVLVSEPVSKIPASDCQAGQRWQWDDVVFSVLHPHDNGSGSRNDRSCVLLVVAADLSSTLLAGDIEARGEQQLVDYGIPSVDILLAPHHGSSTSSGAAIVRAASPRFVVHTTGYRNRYGFPHKEVTDAYQTIGALQFNTALSGAVTFAVGGNANIAVDQYRPRHRSLWHQQFPADKLR